MQKIAAALALLSGLAIADISDLSIPHDPIDSAAIPKVVYIDQNNDSILSKVNNHIIDTLNLYLNGGLTGALWKSNGSARITIDNDANSTAEAFAVTRNGATDTLFRCLDLDLNCRLFGAVTISGAATLSSTLDVTGKAGTADSLYAEDGLRVGSVAASNVNWNRSGANMWNTPDSASIAGKISVTDSIFGASGGRLTGGLSVGRAASPSASLDVTGSNSASSRATIFRTGLTTGGAAADYVDVLFRHINSVGGYIDGASIRSVVVDPSNGVRTSNLQLYGSNNETQTLGLTIGPTGKGTFNDSIIGASQRLTGSLTADTLISTKFYAEGTFTGTLTGCTTSPTVTIYYVRIGKHVTLTIPTSITATSNATTATITGLPAALQPARSQFMAYDGVWNNSSTYMGSIGISLSAGLDRLDLFYHSAAGTASTNSFTSSGTKGLDPGTISYILN